MQIKMNILKISIYIAIAGMAIKSLTGDTNGLLLCGFSLISLLLIDLKLVAIQENTEELEMKKKARFPKET